MPNPGEDAIRAAEKSGRVDATLGFVRETLQKQQDAIDALNESIVALRIKLAAETAKIAIAITIGAFILAKAAEIAIGNLSK